MTTMTKLSNERVGEVMVGAETILYALFPVLIAHATKIMPPILFAGLSTVTAAVALFIYMILVGEIKRINHPKTIKYTIGVALFSIIIPSALIFLGSSKTSGINTSILLQSEILFTFLICGIFTHERLTSRKILGAILMVAGALFILFNGTFKINSGDLLILAGTLFYPIGNILGKKALTFSTPSVILFTRSLLGGVALLVISSQFEKWDTPIEQIIANNYLFILANGMLIYAVSKIFWYEGLKRIDISKAVLINVGAYPVMSLLFAYLFSKEIPTVFQAIGSIIILFGIYQIIEKKESRFNLG